MNSRFLLENTLGVNFEREARKNKIFHGLIVGLMGISLFVVMTIAMKGCLDELDKPAYTEQVMLVPDHADPNYFAWKMQNDPDFRKEVEKSDREDAARFKL